MTWARPDLLALLLLVPAVLIGVIASERARRRLLAAFAALESWPTVVGAGVLRARAWQGVMAVIAVLALAVAAAGPRLGFEWQQQSVEGVAIVVVLDVSRSMDAQDATPSRLECARREIVDLVGMLRGDSVGLVIFAAGPYVRIPLTVDYDTFLWAVEDSSSDTIRAQGSALAGALDAATGLLAKAAGSGKAVVLVSDGEGHDDSAELDAALDRARGEGVRVYALGVGEPSGAPIPLETGGFKKDAAGNVVLTRLDEAALRKLAATTGGAYVRAVASDDDVRALYVDEIRGKLDAAERGMRREKLWHERFQWPLGLALLALATSSALGIGRRGRSTGARAAAMVLLALTFSPGSAWAGTTEEGMAALRAEEWSKAIGLLGQAHVEDPDDEHVTNGLAQALYREGRFREAEELFQGLAENDAANKAVHLYNAGNAAYRGGRLGEALESYRGAIAADPQMQPAQKNATAVEREIAMRTRPPPPEEQQGEGGGEGESGEQSASSGQQSGSESQEGQPGSEQQGEDAAQAAQDAAQPGAEGEGAEQQPGEGAEQAPTPGGQASSEGETGPDKEGATREGTAAAEGQPDGAKAEEGGTTTLSAEGEQGGEGESSTVASSGGSAGGSGDLTREQAARLVDSIADGKPRVVVGGNDTEKDW